VEVLPVVATRAPVVATPAEALQHAFSPNTAKVREQYGTLAAPLAASAISYKRILNWSKAGCPAPVRL